MKTNRVRKREKLLFLLIILEFLTAAYDVVFNEMRMIKPIDATYHFQLSDIPLGAATVTLVGYVLYLVARGIIFNFNKKQGKPGITRRVNPHFGWMGFLASLVFWEFQCIVCKGRYGRFSFLFFLAFLVFL